MNKKQGTILGRGITVALVVLVITMIASFVADVYTIPANNDASLAQLNGGSEEYLAMRTTTKLVQASQDIVWILGVCMIVIAGTLTGIKIKTAQNNEEKEVDPENTNVKNA